MPRGQFLTSPRQAPDARALLNRQHPLARELRYLTTPTPGAVRDRVSGYSYAYAGTQGTSITPEGVAFNTGDGLSRATLAPLQWNNSNTEITVAIRLRPQVQSGSYNNFLSIGTRNSGSYLVIYGAGDAGPSQSYSVDFRPAGASSDMTGSIPVNQGRVQIVAFVARGVSDQRLYVDGVESASRTKNITGSGAASWNSLCIGNFFNDASANLPGASDCLWFGLWQRAFSVDEVAWLSREPYAMLAAPPRASRATLLQVRRRPFLTVVS